MTLEQLRIFVCVAERLHMTRAAAVLNITQSAASAAIAALESRHGVLLFDRVGRGLALSEAGRVFLPEARAVLTRAGVANQALEDLANLKRGFIAIAASQTVANYWLPSRMARFANIYKGIDIKLMVGNTAYVAEAVLEGVANLGFVEGEIDSPLLNKTQLYVDRIALYAAPMHPSTTVALQPADLEEFYWVRREAGSGTRSEFETALFERGVTISRLRTVLELPSNEAVLDAVASGGLVAAVSELAAEPFVAMGRLARLEFDLPTRNFDLVTHRERSLSKAAAAFVASIRRTVE